MAVQHFTCALRASPSPKPVWSVSPSPDRRSVVVQQHKLRRPLQRLVCSRVHHRQQQHLQVRHLGNMDLLERAADMRRFVTAAGIALCGSINLLSDVNECATSNGGCENTCTNTNGSYACSCVGGVLNPDGITCQRLLGNIVCV